MDLKLSYSEIYTGEHPCYNKAKGGVPVGKRNKLFMVLIGALRAAALLCSTGTLIQTLMHALGFHEDWIYLHSTVIQAVSVLSVLLSARFADKDPVRRSAWVQLPVALLFLCYVPLCIWKDGSAGSFALLLAVGVIQTVFNGLFTVCDYKLPYYLFTPEEFGPFLSMVGVTLSLVSLAIGWLVSALSEMMAFTQLMLWGFLVAAVLMLISFGLQWNLRPLQDRGTTPTEKQQKLPLKQVLLAPVFRKLFAANLMRGFNTGAISVLPVMVISLGFDQTVTTAMVSVSAAAGLVGYILFSWLGRRMAYKNMVFVGSLLILPLLAMLIPDATVLLVAYGVLNIGKIVVDNAVPAALLRAVPVQIAGPYNAWRMTVHFTGTLLGTAAATVIPVPAVIVIAAAVQLISGWVYAHAAVMNPN